MNVQNYQSVDLFREIYEDLMLFGKKNHEIILLKQNEKGILIPSTSEKPSLTHRIINAIRSPLSSKKQRLKIAHVVLNFFEANKTVLHSDKDLKLLKKLKQFLSQNNFDIKQRFAHLKISIIQASIPLSIINQAKTEASEIVQSASQWADTIRQETEEMNCKFFQQAYSKIQNMQEEEHNRQLVALKKINQLKTDIKTLEEEIFNMKEGQKPFLNVLVICQDKEIFTHSFFVGEIPFFKAGIFGPLNHQTLLDEYKALYPQLEYSFNLSEFSSEGIIRFLNLLKDKTKSLYEISDLNLLIEIYKIADFLNTSYIEDYCFDAIVELFTNNTIISTDLVFIVNNLQIKLNQLILLLKVKFFKFNPSLKKQIITIFYFKNNFNLLIFLKNLFNHKVINFSEFFQNLNIDKFQIEDLILLLEDNVFDFEQAQKQHLVEFVIQKYSENEDENTDKDLSVEQQGKISKFVENYKLSQEIKNFDKTLFCSPDQCYQKFKVYPEQRIKFYDDYFKTGVVKGMNQEKKLIVKLDQKESYLVIETFKDYPFDVL